ILTDHLDRAPQALDFLESLHARGARSGDSCLMAAAVALALGRLASAERALQLGAEAVGEDKSHVHAGLKLELWRRRKSNAPAVEASLRSAARAGDERSVRVLSTRLADKQDVRAVEQLLADVPQP